MSAEKGWIVEPPPPPTEWRDSHYSREADKIARIAAEQMKIAEKTAIQKPPVR